MTLITDSKDERLVVRVYRNAPEGLVRAMEDINVLAVSLRAMIAERDALLKAKEVAESQLCRAKEACGFKTPWPVMEVLERLASFATMMLRERNYDGHGWEQLQVAAQTAPHLSKAILEVLSSSAPCPHEAEAKRLAEDHVAYLCYHEHGDHPTTIHICDSDFPGAFKVYRRCADAGREGK